jgi:nucleoid-associated protein YejK
MIVLIREDDGSVVGKIDEAEFQVLVDQLEEESEGDTDYYITAQTIEMLQDRGADQTLVSLLEKAVGDSEGVEVSWNTE